MGRPPKIRDPLTLSEASKRYGLADSTLRLWISKGQLKSQGSRPTRISKRALTVLLVSVGRLVAQNTPLSDQPAPRHHNHDQLLTLAQVADILGVKKQTASAYKSEGKLKSYRRSDVLAFQEHRASRAGYTKTGLADERAEGYRLDNVHKVIRNLRDQNAVYDAVAVDGVAANIGRLISTHRQRAAQRIAATVIIELGELGIELASEYRTAIARAVGDVLDMQGQAMDRALAQLLEAGKTPTH